MAVWLPGEVGVLGTRIYIVNEWGWGGGGGVGEIALLNLSPQSRQRAILFALGR